MSLQEQEIIGSMAAGMVEDEITWLFNFSPCNRYNHPKILMCRDNSKVITTLDVMSKLHIMKK